MSKLVESTFVTLDGVIFPAFAGSGARLFDGFDLTHLKLLDTTTFSTGIVVMVYAPK